jgi:hypothetical protein
MGLLTALGLAYGAHQKAKSDAQDRENQLELERQKLADDEANSEASRAEAAARAKIDQDRLALEQRAGGIDPSTGQPFPFTADKQFNGGRGPTPDAADTPDNMVKRYLRLADQAMAANRPDLAASYRAQASAISLGLYRGAQTTEITEGKLPEEQARTLLYQAQASYWKQKAPIEKAKLDALLAHYKSTDAIAYARISQSYQNALVRASAMNGTQEMHEWIAVQTALNAANRQNQSEAFQSALAQANAMNKDIERQNAFARATGGSSQPFVSPQQLYQQNAPAQPIVIPSGGPAVQQYFVYPDGRPAPAPGGGGVPAGAVSGATRPHFNVQTDPKVTGYVASMQPYLARNGMAKTQAYLNQAVQSGAINQAEAQQIIAQLRASSPAQAPTSTFRVNRPAPPPIKLEF